MEVFGKSMVDVPTNVIYLSSILGQDWPNPVHKCDWKCENEHVCGNMYRCRITGLTHICDKNCNQRILYDNHSSLCRVSKQIFPLTPVEQQAVKGVRRKLDAESGPTESFTFKRRRDAQCHPSPFERSFSAEKQYFSSMNCSLGVCRAFASQSLTPSRADFSAFRFHSRTLLTFRVSVTLRPHFVHSNMASTCAPHYTWRYSFVRAIPFICHKTFKRNFSSGVMCFCLL